MEKQTNKKNLGNFEVEEKWEKTHLPDTDAY